MYCRCNCILHVIFKHVSEVEDLEVVRVVKVLALDTVSGTDGPFLVIDGGTAEVEMETEGNVLEAELVRQLPGCGFCPSHDLVESPTEGWLPVGGR